MLTSYTLTMTGICVVLDTAWQEDHRRVYYGAQILPLYPLLTSKVMPRSREFNEGVLPALLVSSSLDSVL